MKLPGTFIRVERGRRGRLAHLCWETSIGNCQMDSPANSCPLSKTRKDLDRTNQIINGNNASTSIQHGQVLLALPTHVNRYLRVVIQVLDNRFAQDRVSSKHADTVRIQQKEKVSERKTNSASFMPMPITVISPCFTDCSIRSG